MITEEYVFVTHECGLGYFAEECIHYSDPVRAELMSAFFRSTNICEPGVSEFCNGCPRNPEVPMVTEVKAEIVLSVFRKSVKEKSWLERQEKEWKELFKKDCGNFLETLI